MNNTFGMAEILDTIERRFDQLDYDTRTAVIKNGWMSEEEFNKTNTECKKMLEKRAVIDEEFTPDLERKKLVIAKCPKPTVETLDDDMTKQAAEVVKDKLKEE